MKNREKIYKRDIAEEIIKYLFTDDIIVLQGARQVGKTFLLYWLQDYLKKKEKTCYYIDLEDWRFVRILDAGVEEFIKHLREEGFLKNKKSKDKLFVFIDEIQYLRNPSSFLKLVADHYREIKLVVSSSSSFEIRSKFKDSLVGRTVNFEIFNLSFAEFLRFKEYYYNSGTSTTEKKTAELKSLFKEFLLYGGYPKIVLTDEVEKKEKYLQQIIDTYIRKDIRDLANIKDIDKFNKLLEVLASQTGNLLSWQELSNTCNLAFQTLEKYLFILEKTYIVKLVRPMYKNIRAEISKMPMVYFYDTGLAHLLWLKELPKQIIGHIFETAVFAELVKKYGQGNIFYWRTKDKKEIDFVVRFKNKILPFEAKLNFNKASLSAFKYFVKKYEASQYKIIGLEGKKKNEFCFYPWEI